MTHRQTLVSQVFLVSALLVPIGCSTWIACDPGEVATCSCSYQADYTVACGSDGYFPDCKCEGGTLVLEPEGPEGGSDTDYNSGNPDLSQENQSAAKRAYERLLDYFPECQMYENDRPRSIFFTLTEAREAPWPWGCA